MTQLPDIARFDDAVVLVTGSSRGIGAGLTRTFARAGARCVVNYVADPQGRNKAEAEQVAAETKAALVVECDVADDARVARMFEQVREAFGGLDVLVNNAGVLRDKTLKKMTPQDWQAVIQVNLTGAFNCIHHAVPVIRNGGRIVNISSVSGLCAANGTARSPTRTARTRSAGWAK